MGNRFKLEIDGRIDEDIYYKLIQNINNEISNIIDFFDVELNNINIKLMSKLKLDEVVKRESKQYINSDIPKWLVGFTTFNGIYCVLPTQENYTEMFKVIIHEIVHMYIYSLGITKPIPKVLDEGLAVFLSKQYENYVFTPWINLYLKSQILKVSDLYTHSMLEFTSKNGYKYVTAIIDFFIKFYGKKNILLWLKQPDEFVLKLEEIDKKFNEYIIKEIETRLK